MDCLIKVKGKPIEKLIEVISNGIGVLYRSRAIRREADAKAYEIKKKKKAKNEALAEKKLIEAEILDRLNQRICAKEIIRQNNIDDVAEIAAKELELETTVSSTPVNKDWSTRFFDIVQDVSDEEMKYLWGKILAGEVKSPKSYGLRTLELLRNLSKEEALLFMKVSQFILKDDTCFIWGGEGLSDFGISYPDIAKLIECGLVQTGTFVQKRYDASPDKNEEFMITYNSQFVLFVTIKKGLIPCYIPVYILTRAGEELYKLLTISPNIDYLKKFALSIKKETVSVAYAPIKSISDDSITFNEELVVEL